MPNPPKLVSRRTILRAGLALAIVRLPSSAGDLLTTIREKGKAAGLGSFEVAETASFRGIGDAPSAFMAEALELCEALAVDYRKHFSKKGFELTRPDEKLLVVLLSGPKSYSSFEGQADLASAVGGHFDLATNYQVTFDFRSKDADAPANAGRVNSFTLVHETIHQLTFNTGVLNLAADVPTAISEGLATYAETWRPRGRGEIGQSNRLRLDGRQTTRWIPLTRLLMEDGLFEEETTRLVAYAEAWTLTYYFLRDPGRVTRYRAYLAALGKKPAPENRLALAAEHLGDLARLDRLVQRSV